MALIRLRVCAGWSEPLLVAHTTLLEISCLGWFIIMFLTWRRVLYLAPGYYVHQSKAKLKKSRSQNDFLFIFSPWSSLWNGQVRDRYRGYVRHATRVDHEIHHSSGHGWYSGHLRSGRCCSYSQRNRCQLWFIQVSIKPKLGNFKPINMSSCVICWYM